LHGDYHPGNVVNATRESYLAIDPKGIVGHIGYDIAVFLNNFHWWQEQRPDIRERIAPAVEQFSNGVRHRSARGPTVGVRTDGAQRVVVVRRDAAVLQQHCG
jgi:streptomycin 6-kinase